MHAEMPVWRSLMYVPVNVEKYVDKAHAKKIIDLDKEAAKSGRGSFALDGKMIDIPIIVRAQKLIARHEAIRKCEAKTLAAMKD